MHAYTPNADPTPILWLTRRAASRRRSIARAHRDAGWPHRGNLALHAREHDLLETALAHGRPAGLRPLVADLRCVGFSRHEALHAIGQLIARPLVAHHRGRAVDLQAALAEAVAGARPELDAVGLAPPGAVLDWLGSIGWRGPSAFATTLLQRRLPGLAPALLALLDTLVLREPDHPRAWALVWAAEALSLARDPRGAAPTLDLLLDVERLGPNAIQFQMAFERYADLAVEPLLARLDAIQPPRLRLTLIAGLIRNDARDPRLHPALRALHDFDPRQVERLCDRIRQPADGRPTLTLRMPGATTDEIPAATARLRAFLPGARASFVS